MERLRCSAALVTALLTFFFGGSLLSNREAHAKPGTTIALRSADPAVRVESSTANVYLFRGLMNVFSLGMDELAGELRAAGLKAVVANHIQWRGVADEIVVKYRAGQRGPIILVGHSLGADAVMSMAEYLGQMGVPVALVVPFDGTSPHTATANVARILNLFKSESVRINPGPGFHGELTNYRIGDANVGHFNIDKNPALHSMVIRKIRAIVSAAERPRGRQSPLLSGLPADRASMHH